MAPPHTPPDDPFDALGLPARFDLSDRDIRRAWLERAGAAHPDHALPSLAFPDRDPSSNDLSAALNAARRTLEEPERRAAALLRRLGGPSADSDRSLPPDVLELFLERTEQVEADRAAGKSLESHERWAEERRDAHIERVATLFRVAQAGAPPDPASLREIRRELNAWRYVERFIEQLDPGYDPSRADFE